MYYNPYFSQRGVACKTDVLHVWFQFYSLCARIAHITLYDVTTWSELSEPRMALLFNNAVCNTVQL